MAENDGILKIFGFEIKKAKKKQEDKLVSVVPATDDDGAGYVSGVGGGHFGQYINMDGENSKDNKELIMRYRGVSQHPEVDMAIEEIVNESITASELQSEVTLSLDDVEAPDKIKKLMLEEFTNILSMLKFKEHGHDMFKTWYVDGRIYHHLVVNDANLKAGIQDIRHIDSAKMRKIKNVKYKRDPATGAKVVDNIEEFFLYEEKPGVSNSGAKLSPDSISYVTSGVLDETKKKVLSHLHKVLKPINQLRMMEDSLVIYRLARAPERRIFYIDVGNLPAGKAQEYMQKIMTKYQNKLVYDANTGQLKDDRKHMSMLEDFWLPRREGGRGTEISTLPGGDNLGQIDDIIYFQKRLYRGLNVPISRLEQEGQFSLGRSSEISREEIKFQKFVDRLRRRFSQVFLGILRKQLIMKGIITDQDWDDWKDNINVDYVKDNHFTELKEMEIIRERLGTMNEAQGFIGEFISKEWAWRNIFRFTDEEIKQLQKEISGEITSGEVIRIGPDGQIMPAGAPTTPSGTNPVSPTDAPPPPPEEEPAPAEEPAPKKKEEEKKESYYSEQEVELIESMSRYMNSITGD